MAYELASAYGVRAIRVSQYARYNFLGRPEPPFRTGLYFAAHVFFVLPRVLRAPSTDRPETLPHGRNLIEFYKLTSKIRGAFPPKNWGGGQKHAKFRSILDHFRL